MENTENKTQKNKTYKNNRTHKQNIKPEQYNTHKNKRHRHNKTQKTHTSIKNI